MTSSLMTIKNVSNITNWSLESGYQGKSNGQEYPRRMFSVGRSSSLFIFLRLHLKDLEYKCTESGLGFRVYLSTPGEAFKMFQQSFRVPLGEDTHITIKSKLTTTSQGLRKYSPEQRQCYFSSERQLRFFKNYTQSNCETECLANFTKIECNCVKFSMPSKKKFSLN